MDTQIIILASISNIVIIKHHTNNMLNHTGSHINSIKVAQLSMVQLLLLEVMEVLDHSILIKLLLVAHKDMVALHNSQCKVRCLVSLSHNRFSFQMIWLALSSEKVEQRSMRYAS